VNTLTLNSYAKLNLYLEVLNIRKDQYHNIKTIFERISLSDKIILRSRQDKKIKIICSSPEIPKDNSNLAYQSAQLLQMSLNINRGADIEIIKHIPVGSGLGGGSSNAAGVLVGLNKLWRLNLSQKELVSYAGKVGCDVPFFVYNISFAQGRARGDKIRQLELLDNVRFWHILVVPKLMVSSARIYKEWDSLRMKLTKPKYNAKILTSALRTFNFALIGEALFNSLEQVTTKLYPQVRRIKEKLKAMGAKSILMSGSGPAVFGIVSSRREGQVLYRQLKEEYRFWQVYLTRTQ
jgi:4-diphosphocytidyl-2-C-methyl-D-erythritol kinase